MKIAFITIEKSHWRESTKTVYHISKPQEPDKVEKYVSDYIDNQIDDCVLYDYEEGLNVITGPNFTFKVRFHIIDGGESLEITE